MTVIAAADGQTGEINGTVSTEGGHPLEGADVSLVNISTGEVEETTVSDANGSYGFTSVGAGSYRVEAEFKGGEDSRDVFNLGEGERRSRDLELTPEGSYFVISVEGTNSPVTAGEDFRVDATVTNEGDEIDTQVVKLDTPEGDGGGFEDIERVRDLSAGSSVTVSLNMSTRLEDGGNYTAEVITDDDTEEVGFVVEPAGIDVSITDTNSPVVEGENLTVEAEVSSDTEATGRGTVTAEVGGLATETEAFSLTDEDEWTGSFEIPTERGDAGEYTVTVSVGDASDPANVTVEEDTEEGENGDDGTGSEDEATDDGSETDGTNGSNGSDTGDSEAETDGPGSDGDGGDTQDPQAFDLGGILRYLGLGVAAVVAVAVIAAASVLVARKVKQKDWGGSESEDDDGGGVALEMDPENDVYGSWNGMIRLASVEDIRTKTPDEIAESAKEAGLDPAAVDELTDVFEEVRYRDAEPTEEQERRAREAFERLERNEAPD